MNVALGLLKRLQPTPLTARQQDWAHESEGAVRSLLGLVKDVATHFDFDSALPRGVVADALRQRQVLINLVGNAIHFIEAGEVRVGLRGVSPV